MPQIKIKKDGEEKTIEVAEGQNILEVALANGLDIMHACGGNGFCTTCICEVKEGAENLEEVTEQEIVMGVEEDSGQRLSCQAKVKGDVSVEFPTI